MVALTLARMMSSGLSLVEVAAYSDALNNDVLVMHLKLLESFRQVVEAAKVTKVTEVVIAVVVILVELVGI